MSEWLYGDTGLRQMSDYGAPTSGTATHLLHLKALKNPIDFMRYMKGVVFPGKEFMMEKYSPLNPPQGGLEKKRGSSFPLEFVRPLTEVRGKYWWLWYGYRWAMGLKGLWLVITRKTEEKKEK